MSEPSAPQPFPLPILVALLLAAVVLFLVGLTLDAPWSGAAAGGGAGLFATTLVLFITGRLRW